VPPQSRFAPVDWQDEKLVREPCLSAPARSQLFRDSGHRHTTCTPASMIPDKRTDYIARDSVLRLLSETWSQILAQLRAVPAVATQARGQGAPSGGSK
jgi:hypothetical protein